MPRKPAPVYTPVDPGPHDLTGPDLWAEGALTLKGAAAFCGLGKTTIQEMVRHNEVPSALVKGRRLIPKRALVLFLAQTHSERTA